MEKKYRITVLMAIYNCAPTLKEAIDSLYAQTYNNFKLVLCDDASTDNTYEIAKQYAEKHDNIVLIQNEKNMKLAYSLNRCLEYADTEYVRSEEHTSELQSRGHLVCRLLLEKK